MIERQPPTVEIEVTEGLERLARAEIAGRLGVRPEQMREGQGWIRFPLAQPGRVTQLRLTESAFRVETFGVPRPKALLGDQHFRRLAAAISEVIATYRPPASTFSVAAAGSSSSVMVRLREALAHTTGLADSGAEGDLQIRLIRSRTTVGWDVLLRLTPHPLSARSWRVCSFPGALNATVASAMAQLTLPGPDDVFVNLMSGSGSILIERRLLGQAAACIGIEYDPAHILCARSNSSEARLDGEAGWLQADVRAIPLPAGCARALCADLPFGQRIGRHDENVRLYPAVFAEAARIAGRGGRFVALSHEVQLMDRVLREQRDWRTVQVLRLNLRGLHPRLYVLERV